MSDAIENTVRRFQIWGRSKAHWLMLAGALIEFSRFIRADVSSPKPWWHLLLGASLVCAAIYWRFKAIPDHKRSQLKSDDHNDKGQHQP
jgi:hypothetical protein